jgi:hypothetical protein
MLDDHQPNMPALKREWFAARIMAVLALVMIGAVAAVQIADNFFAAAPAPGTVVPTEITPPAEVLSIAPTADTRREEEIALCDAALATVQGLGLVPGFATRDGDKAETTTVQGRYICHARTDAAKYSIAFDLTCTRLGGEGCIVPYTVAQTGGNILYQRH